MSTVRRMELMVEQKDTMGGHLGISEAANALGISREAVRQRIRRGTLIASKVDNHWQVQPDEPGRIDETTVGTSYATSTGIEFGAADRELIAILREEVAFLRKALEERTAELRRKDELIGTVMQRLLPPAGTPEPASANVSRNEA